MIHDLRRMTEVLGVFGFLLLAVISCTREMPISAPVVPVIPTLTPTVAPVLTSTPTATFTYTSLVVSTNTPTSIPTSTPSNTPVGITSTFTNTITNTPTTSLTSTPTNTATTGGATNTFTNTVTATITATPTNTDTATVTSTPGGSATAFYLYQCGTLASAPDYGSILAGGTNIPNYNTTFTSNPDTMDTTCVSGDNLDIGVPPSGAILSFLAILPSTATVNLTGLTTCSFDAWCSTATGFSFGAGLASGDTTLTPVTLVANTWTNFQISLPSSDLSAAATIFYLNYSGTTAGQNLALDQIYLH